MRADRKLGPLLLMTCLALCQGPGAAAQDGDALAIVDGRVVTRTRLVELLMEAHGLRMLQQVTLLELAKAETQRRGLAVSQADVDAEFERALAEMAADMKEEEATRENKLKALKAVIANNGVTMTEYMIALERNAHLRKLVSYKVSEETLREEFARTFGERAVVRHVQVADLRRMNAVLDALSRGRDFADVAREFSENQISGPRGGELDPFTFQDERVPPALREAAFLLKTGEVSPVIKTERYFHVLRLEQRLPPENVRFEDVRGQVEARLRSRVERQEMDSILKGLFQAAKVRILDPELRGRYEAFLREAEVTDRTRRP
ncbi:MAG: peptidylprolyl isomerase [Phycisphaerae bacterium]|nr:peptidyl-prolyl cis-trans isomerase [Phycisphaerae bacterium]MCZ2398255.1 peptidylprolyl isomerase [Phycisphaerae bacterium]NUQ50482.1 peptidyl-prolyl cis-trans isomerase [Phycisphaerae bacterium]